MSYIKQTETTVYNAKSNRSGASTRHQHEAQPLPSRSGPASTNLGAARGLAQQEIQQLNRSLPRTISQRKKDANSARQNEAPKPTAPSSGKLKSPLARFRTKVAAAQDSSSKIPTPNRPAVVSKRHGESTFILHPFVSPSAKSRVPHRDVAPTAIQHESPTSNLNAGHPPLNARGQHLLHLHPQQYQFSPSQSPPDNAASVLSQRRLKAMQLGVFKISEAELRERYQFLNEIGAGEWGSIWAVEALKPMDHLPSSAYRTRQVVKLSGRGTYMVDNSPSFRPLAVKLCKRESKSDSAERTKRLWNEFKILRTLMDQLPRAEQANPNSPTFRVRNDRTGWHPNIVNFYEFLLTPTLAMLVMPKYDEPMKVCLPPETYQLYFQQLLSAVHWLHQYYVCHNDIKVDNLLVTFDTSGLGRHTVTLVDFGFANRYDPATQDAFHSTDSWGTPEYLAPERIDGELHDERKSDMWALGITFFEIITGRTPFERHDEKFNTKEKFQEYYERVRRGHWLGEWEIPSATEDLIRRMLKSQPGERIDAAGALLHTCFDPCASKPKDSLDELLQLPYEEELEEDKLALPHTLAEELSGDTDDMIGELVGETASALRVSEDRSSLQDSPGVGRAAAVVAQHCLATPHSPSLSQVGMDSRLTDLMSASPPWKRNQQPRRGTPIPSSRRNKILVDVHSCENSDNDEDAVDEVKGPDESPASNRYEAYIAEASRATPTTGPILITGKRESVSKQCDPTAPVKASLPQHPADQNKPATLSAAETCRQSFLSRPTNGGGNMVASLAKKFDASNFLSRPPPYVTAATSSKMLDKAVFKAAVSSVALGHRRSKSCPQSQLPMERKSFRHSIGVQVSASIGSHGSGSIKADGMHARLFGRPLPSSTAARPRKDSEASRTDSTVDSAVLRGLDVTGSPMPKKIGSDCTINRTAAGGMQNKAMSGAAVRITDSAQPTSASLSPFRSLRRKEVSQTRDCDPCRSSPGEEVIVHKLKRMASLAGMLTKMIDETKTTILSPNRSVAVSSTIASPDATFPRSTSPTESPFGENGVDEGDVSLVSANYSLDLSSTLPKEKQRSGLTQPTSETTASASNASNVGGIGQLGVLTPIKTPPSPTAVEGMYSSFLLSQNVARAGSGYLSPIAPVPSPTVSRTGSSHNDKKCRPATGGDKRRSLASFFVSPSSPTFAHLLFDATPSNTMVGGGGESKKKVIGQRQQNQGGTGIPRAATFNTGVGTLNTGKPSVPSTMSTKKEPRNTEIAVVSSDNAVFEMVHCSGPIKDREGGSVARNARDGRREAPHCCASVSSGCRTADKTKIQLQVIQGDKKIRAERQDPTIPTKTGVSRDNNPVQENAINCGSKQSAGSAGKGSRLGRLFRMGS